MPYVADSFERDLNQIELTQQVEKFTGSTRFQLPAEVSRSEVVSYAKRYGIRHARELEDAMKVIGKSIRTQLSVVDLGCGPGMSARVLVGLNFQVGTYFGQDHSPSQVWLARHLNAGQQFASNFSSRLDSFTPTQEHTLVIMNHICHQDGVTESDLEHWAMNLNRIIPSPYQLLSIEPPLNGTKQNQLLQIFRARGRATQILHNVKTPGQFRASKVTQLIAIS